MGRLVQRSIEKLQPPDTGNRITWDSELPSFGVRITAAGAISYILDYRIFGRQRRYTIGRHPELSVVAARSLAISLRDDIRHGIDPMEERQNARSEPSVEDLATRYLEEIAAPHKRASSLKNDKYMINSILSPRIGRLRLKAVGKRDIESLHASLKGTPYLANRVLALLSKMFNTAVDWKWTSDNPAKGIPRFHEEKRERWLSTEEIASFKAGLDTYKDQNAANALRLLLLTGARAGEVLKATWEQLDLERGVWTKPSHHTKQKKTEHVPLNAPTRALLRSMKPRGHAHGPLFVGADGKNARVSIRRPWLQACKAAGLVKIDEKQGKRRKVKVYRPTVRLHDLRHSYASHLVSNGVSLSKVGELLGHTQPQTTSRYAHLSQEALQQATDIFGSIYEASGTRVPNKKKPRRSQG